VRGLHDERASWPQAGNLHLDGFRYEDLMIHPQKTAKDRANNSFAMKHPISVADRLDWLNLQPQTEIAERQPWMQLADLLRDRGDEAGAKHVVFGFHQAQARALPWYFRCPKILFARLQQKPFWILLPVTLSTAIASLIFWFGSMQGAIAPTNGEAYAAWARGSAHHAYPPFQPVVYALENDLPLVKFGQDEKWAPDTDHHPNYWIDSYGFLYGTRIILIALGWAQATILASALGSRFK
jgi:hypothetical protein